MIKVLSVGLLVALAGCSAVPRASVRSACAAGEASYPCQVERYQQVSAQ